ncbi:hypothetical protein BH688_13770 [Kushneria phosphatilytica]|uniref:Lipoprotein n=2 Tax=Kushneria phosphatilytica TaxID=657387 RepID=A0A1S1NSC7_9GAMM|nr:hypothetical protein BH688_13770 [Kushneria phosphatilytica]QEL12648.1 lipoprotein [Kushneria phosphatilytica]
MYLRLVLGALALPLVLAGCGQKGPLYLPSNQQAQEKYDPQHAYESESDGNNKPSDQPQHAPDEKSGTPPGGAIDDSHSQTPTMPDTQSPGARDTGEQSSVPNIGSGVGTTTNPVGGPGGTPQ